MSTRRVKWLDRARPVAAMAVMIGLAAALQVSPAFGETHGGVNAGGVGATAEGATTSHISDPRIVVRFNLASGETPEAIALAPRGSADISLAKASTAVNVGRDGRVAPLGEVPQTGACPTLGIPFGAGIARSPRGAVYLVNCSCAWSAPNKPSCSGSP